MNTKVALIKPVIYYYLDQEGNKRPIDFQVNDGFDYMVDAETIEQINEYFPETEKNLYVIIGSFEFKLA